MAPMSRIALARASDGDAPVATYSSIVALQVVLKLLGELLFDAIAAEQRAETQAKPSGPAHGALNEVGGLRQCLSHQ